jgi:4-hydroxythreonine-4-phosphate dehydrogenase
LNPHAGDSGLLGSEEKEIILPAIRKAQEQGILAYGPYPADGLFGSGEFSKFDAVLAMYHDQGLVAFKSLCFGNGVNFTAGLPVVRTSPDHGTAFDIAGKNIAMPDSFREALLTARDIVKCRKDFHDATANPLKKQHMEMER